MTLSEVRLSAVMAPCFFDVHKAVKSQAYTHYWLSGGRASAKSSYVSLEIIQGMMREPLAHAIVFRRYANGLADSVVAQCLWAINILGVDAYWRYQKNPKELIYKPTGQRIIFRGLDDPEKPKGIKLAFGHFKFAWFEELTEYAGMEEIETVNRSIVRGQGHCNVFYTYNPPKSRNNWVNSERLAEKGNRLVHHSTYLDVPQEWLGEQFLEEAGETKRVNEIKYRWAYLGEATGTGGAVFDNVELRMITDEEIQEFGRTYQGVDWGYYPDPYAWLKMSYAAAQEILYIFDEYVANRKSNRQTADTLLTEKGVGRNDLVIADNAELKSIADYRSYGLNCYPVKKGPGSVDYSMKWMQARRSIIIDPVRCPKAAKEFMEYEYDRDRSGIVLEGYPDANNHCIDAARYGMWPVWKRKGE